MSLNFPEKYQFRLRKVNNVIQIFCPIRKSWFVNTPEEWVRQHCIQYLHEFSGIPFQNMVAEFPVNIHQLHQRADILVYKNARPWILCECKKPEVKLNQEVLNQAMRYAQALQTPYLYLSNGLEHLFALVDFENKKLEKIKALPSYEIASSR